VIRFGVLICFALLGALSVTNGTAVEAIPLLGIAGFGLGWLLLILLGWLLRLFGLPGAKTAVSRGFLLLIPFTTLAFVAEWALAWQVVGVFATAGIMTSCAAVGIELTQAGGGKLRSNLLPVLGGAAMTTIWVIATTWLGSELAGWLS
jgi:hypothetical protein